MSFAYTKKINFSFLEALDEVRIAFAEKGYGVVSNINIGEKIRGSIDSEFKEYVIFGLCDPRLAHKFLSADMSLGVFMPCTVAIYEKNDGVYVSAGMPDPMIETFVNSNKVDECLYEVSVTFKRIIDSI